MKDKEARNLSTSVRARLLNIAKDQGEEFEFTLTRFASERLVYRLSRSQYRDRFVLKGATLFALWTGALHRPTRDIDLLAFGSSEPVTLVEIFTAICAQPVEDDGVFFDPTTVRAEAMRSDEEYQGIRIRLEAHLGTAKTPLQIDIGFGDAVTPSPKEAELPALLNLPRPQLLVYPRESVIAEKFEAMVDLGMANSRVKDFFDIWFLLRHFDFDAEVISRALRNTFERRGTGLPSEPPIALTPAYTEDPQHKGQWSAFLQRSRLEHATIPPLRQIADEIAGFLIPVLSEKTERPPVERMWSHKDLQWRAKLAE